MTLCICTDGGQENGTIQLNTVSSSAPINANGAHAYSDTTHQPSMREVDFLKVSISEALSILKVNLLLLFACDMVHHAYLPF